ncbi:NADP-dependent oxidoreductase [Catalinimonas niigatensis]|uniref:NADP-dependent oxidoreductase n=1 Tax=Catalinimonas niigatensis TaxID=1397264 RepID=UPI002665D144|nr:NADP-dependent oxidoreductase [Catalinimonas niigatensis]WPP53460.1 NADP-dependent oxidoreductase [Catalinimonas niigatensis]
MANQIILANRPQGEPTADTFKKEEVSLPELKEGEVHLTTKYFSVDPYMRGRMNDAKSYVPPFEVGKPISGGAIAEVVESKSESFQTGELVLGTLPWATEAVVKAEGLQKVKKEDVPDHYYLGILGMPGLTAYFGLMDIGKPKAGETVVVSGAAGAVGLVVGQIAKIQGCRVVGIAGSDEKIQMLKEQFGYDEGINYKTNKDLKAAVAAACPDGVDVYFDNVGGEVSDAVIMNLNFHARIPLCGQISLYNASGTPTGPRIQPMLLTRSVLMKGFIVRNYQDKFPEGIQQLSTWVKEDKLKFTETIIQGFERLPEAFLGLFTGKNQGKMIVEV